MAGWTVVPNQDTSAWKPVNPASNTAQAAPPPEGFWESLGHTFGIGKEEQAAQAKDVQEHPLVTALKAAIPGWEAVQGAVHGIQRSGGELNKSAAELRSGDVGQAAVHGIQALPFVGPAIQHGAEQLNPGESINPAEVGTALGTAVQAAPMVLGAADSAFPGRPALPDPVAVAGNAVKPLLTGDVNAPIPGTDVTPAARYQSMKSMGIQPNAAEATNSTPLSIAEKFNQNSLTAARSYADARAANLDALNDYTKHALDSMSTKGPEEGGAAVQQGLLKSHADLKTAATEAYKDLDAQVGNQPLAGAAGLRQQAQAILDANAPYYKAHPELEPTKAMAIVRDLAGAKGTPKAAPTVVSGFGPTPPAPEVAPPRVPTYSELHRLRSDLLDFNNTNPDLVKNQANGWISQLAGAADHAITSGESALTPDQVETFRNANDAWKFMKATYDNPSHPLYQAVRSTAPSTLVNGISKTPEMAKLLQTVLQPEEIGPIQRGVAENLLKTTKEGGYNFKTFQGQWNKLPQSYREALFTPEQIQQLEGIGHAGTVLNTEPNPSGSARLGQGIAEGAEFLRSVPSPHELAGNLVYHGAQYGLGKLMNSPKFVDWLMQGRGFAPIEDAGAAAVPAVNRMIPAAVASGAISSGWDFQNNRPKQ